MVMKVVGKIDALLSAGESLKNGQPTQTPRSWSVSAITSNFVSVEMIVVGHFA